MGLPSGYSISTDCPRSIRIVTVRETPNVDLDHFNLHEEEQDPTQTAEIAGICGSVERASPKVSKTVRPIYGVSADGAIVPVDGEATQEAMEDGMVPKEKVYPNVYSVFGKMEEGFQTVG